jgi:hypothetical protein
MTGAIGNLCVLLWMGKWQEIVLIFDFFFVIDTLCDDNLKNESCPTNSKEKKKKANTSS